MRKFIIKTLSTFFYVGYLPYIPGTFGSLAGICVYYFIKGDGFLYSSITLSLLVAGFLVTRAAEELFHKKDAKCIVIDEVVGMLLSLVFIPYQLKLVILGFIIFRILDAMKPFPAGRLERLKGSLGIMSDDIIAGLYTNIILQVALRFASFKTS